MICNYFKMERIAYICKNMIIIIKLFTNDFVIKISNIFNELITYYSYFIKKDTELKIECNFLDLLKCKKNKEKSLISSYFSNHCFDNNVINKYLKTLWNLFYFRELTVKYGERFNFHPLLLTHQKTERKMVDFFISSLNRKFKSKLVKREMTLKMLYINFENLLNESISSKLNIDIFFEEFYEEITHYLSKNVAIILIVNINQEINNEKANNEDLFYVKTHLDDLIDKTFHLKYFQIILLKEKKEMLDCYCELKIDFSDNSIIKDLLKFYLQSANFEIENENELNKYSNKLSRFLSEENRRNLYTFFNKFQNKLIN